MTSQPLKRGGPDCQGLPLTLLQKQLASSTAMDNSLRSVATAHAGLVQRLHKYVGNANIMGVACHMRMHAGMHGPACTFTRTCMHAVAYAMQHATLIIPAWGTMFIGFQNIFTKCACRESMVVALQFLGDLHPSTHNPQPSFTAAPGDNINTSVVLGCDGAPTAARMSRVLKLGSLCMKRLRNGDIYQARPQLARMITCIMQPTRARPPSLLRATATASCTHATRLCM